MTPLTKRLYWQLTALLLAVHFVHGGPALALAIALNVLQVVHVTLRRRGVRALDAQVRVAYLALLVLGTAPGLWPIHVVQFVGVNALLVADYCLLARLLTLLPWNRPRPLSIALVRDVLLTPPAPGPIAARLAVTATGR
jgi:hypothetical protein